MRTQLGQIRGAVSPAILEKVNRLFRNDDAGVWIEMLQNSRRAKSTRVRMQIEETDAGCRTTIEDDGLGIENFQSLLTLGASDWSSEVRAAEDTAGMGFFALCHSEVEVHSGSKYVRITPDVFLGKCEADVTSLPEVICGTRIRFNRQSRKTALVAALERVAEFCPLEVVLDKQVLPQHDFLEGALFRETIDGIEIGIAPEFRWDPGHYQGNWNFHGARIRHEFACPHGLVTRDDRGCWLSVAVEARFNVQNTGAVKLQLPDRRAIVEDEGFQSFRTKARAAVYRFFQSQGRHVLSFQNWSEARELGVLLPEAVALLKTWHAAPCDEFLEPLFGAPETQLVENLSSVLLVDAAVPHAHTLEAALETGGSFGADLYQENRAFEGYTWYAKLPHVVDAQAFLDGTQYKLWRQETGKRPDQINIEIAIRSAEGEETKTLPALIHVDSESPNEPTFAAIANSPWDRDDIAGPFSVSDFLVWATFSSSDDCAEWDSWETQFNEYHDTVERLVNEYFRGTRAALLSLLRQAFSWTVHEYLSQLGIAEIRFRRVADQWSWDVTLDDAPGRQAAGLPFYKIADVNTHYLPESDYALLERQDCPTRFAATDDGGGTFHWVSDDDRTFTEDMRQVTEFGLSDRFRRIMARAREARIPYVRFDADGGEIDGLDVASNEDPEVVKE